MILSLLRSSVIEATIQPFFRSKSANICQIDSNKVKLELDLCNCIKTKTIETAALPQQPYKRGTIFWETLHRMHYRKTALTGFLISSSIIAILRTGWTKNCNAAEVVLMQGRREGALGPRSEGLKGRRRKSFSDHTPFSRVKCITMYENFT